jgi:cephalosporin-C deacetylase-like acetyl esterase
MPSIAEYFMTHTWQPFVLSFFTLLTASLPLTLADDAGDIAKNIPDVLTKEQQAEARGMIQRYIARETKAVNVRNREDWLKVKTREQWEKYRDDRIAALRRSLGEYPKPGKLAWRVTGMVEGAGFKIENVVYESRPGQWVTGNLYIPANPSKSMPGILIAHAHHRDKPQSELQDMGMTWARAGCMVLVIDQVGYGERRSHPFHGDADYPKPYKTSRQDYYFRYDTGIQLQLVGDSLMGWMAWDLMRGVDLLLGKEGIDPKRIILLGAVAGGGDPAGVTAALDPRIACCVPFNFGSCQPENRYPLPDDAETSFNYLGWSYFDSTRGLRLGGRDDFLHWVIVSSTAPRYLIHAHEFSWDEPRDPVWKRYQKIWGEFYGAGDHIGFAHGKGLVTLRPPVASHCTNIGAFHRKMIHPLFAKWFDIKVTEKDEYSAPRKREELNCMTEKARQELHPKTLNELMSSLATERIEKARARLTGKDPAERRQILRADWSRLLGPIAPQRFKIPEAVGETMAGMKIERVKLEVEPDMTIPVLILSPIKNQAKGPVVIGLSHNGKAGFLKNRADELAKLIQAGAVVVLPDLRGIGETASGNAYGPNTTDTNNSVYVQLFGETLLGERLRDLRSVLTYVRSRADVDAKRIALWGDSFAPPNGPDTNYKIPRGADEWPGQSQPLGGLLCLLGGLFEDDVRAVYVSGGLASYHSVLTHFAVMIPHGTSVPGALTAGDLCDLAGSLAPRPLRFEMTVDHLNRVVSGDALRKTMGPTAEAYSAAPKALSMAEARSSVANWLLEQLQ